MRTKDLVLLALFMGIGAVLHIIAPPILFGMKPDIMLPMMFLGILLFPHVKYVLVLSLATGVISALTTAAPGGQVSNLIEKPITAFIFFALLLIIPKQVNQKVLAPILVAIGTFVSGTIFLTLALYVIGLMEGAFTVMVAGVVLPAVLFNVVFTIVLYPIIQSILQRSNFKFA
ncbi:Tryptophan transporter TrpP [Pelagirhabdus alkalitolerans]|uniref:Tryptophan transporter TrpP n=1 Tax=Pelagirhabdus alkalitolerans TaxID=1612202 RepID=A0A1G6LLR2_9BACI|nr:tryptophan transporter [Pelagirhabdus alkalitolerans]SDC44141.1 Tryptophan transporter TrpP [Pelagirhabdus alkalitolerans]